MGKKKKKNPAYSFARRFARLEEIATGIKYRASTIPSGKKYKRKSKYRDDTPE